MELPENTGINKYAIKLVKSKQLFYRSIYFLSPVQLKTLKTYILTLLKTTFIWRFKSSADASTIFDKKPDGSFCLYVNYQALNNLTIKNRYPLSLIGKFLDWLDRVKQFIQLNLTSAYHRLKIQKDDKWKTVFHIKYAHFEYQVIFFRLSNISASFEDYINKMFTKKLNIIVIVYSDDMLIYTKNAGQPLIEVVYLVLENLCSPKIFAKQKKCQFHQNEVWFLRFVVLAQCIRIEEKKIEAVKTWSEPPSIRDIQVCLSFANF